MKQILITGANSYIGGSVEKYLKKNPKSYCVDTLDMMDAKWVQHDFSRYDSVFHVAGIAHADIGSVSEEEKQKYYKVNTELTLKVAEKARESGVAQFIFMSSMIVYGGCKDKIITRETIPQPANFYGDSKWQADQKLQRMESDTFHVVILRPPMIYGRGSKGNYPELAKLATKLPIFPKVENKRSMLHIDNLCEFVKLMIDNCVGGIFFPQNDEYTSTSRMVKMIADAKGHKLQLVPGFGWTIRLLMRMPGKIGRLATKAFGDSVYDLAMSQYKTNYRIRSLEESIRVTEGLDLREKD